jgi:uroporphyrinogen-III synthase
VSEGRRRVLFTRPLAGDDPAHELLHRTGCAALVLEVLSFEPGSDTAALAGRIFAQPRPDAIALTSARAASALAHALGSVPAAALSGLPPCFAVGAATAAPLESAGVRCEVSPEASAASLAEHLRARFPGRARALFLKGNLALETLPAALRESGWEVEELEVYRTRPASVKTAALRSALGKGTLVASVFASPSAAAALRQNLDTASWRQLMRLPAVVSGDTTATALERAGAEDLRRASSPGPRGMADALREVLEESAPRITET